MRKNPMYANVEELRCGDLLEEINDNSTTNIAGGTLTLTALIVPYGINQGMSYLVGNRSPKICTFTVECMGSGCRG